MSTRGPLLPTLLVGVATGVVASWVKSQDEPLLQKVAERLVPPAPPEKGLPAADPDNTAVMPPALVVDEAHKAATGTPATLRQKTALTPVLHYGMGTVQATAYVLAARRWPAVTTGFGTLAGAAAFLGTHGSALPAMGVQPAPARLPTSWWLWEGGSHVLFGVTVELLRRVAANSGRVPGMTGPS